MTFESARSECKKDGGDVVETHDRHINDAVADIMRNEKINWSWLGFKKGTSTTIHMT